jgi:hypothetical protein
LEKAELIIATEHQSDFKILQGFASKLGITKTAYNLQIFSFSRWKYCIEYKQQYVTVMKEHPDFTLLLDRDYYPHGYLANIKTQLGKYNIEVFFTPGKEVENIFLDEVFLTQIIPSNQSKQLLDILNTIYLDEYDSCLFKYLDYMAKYSDTGKGEINSAMEYRRQFDFAWASRTKRHNLISGKAALKKLRRMLKEKLDLTLSTLLLIDSYNIRGYPDLVEMVQSIYKTSVR